jgi:biopolymer transport protein ExbD
MVFQLITFFMLVINFKTASLDFRLALPVIGSARPAESTGREDVLVLNLNSEGQLMVYGQPREIETYVAEEATASVITARRNNPDFRPGDDLPTTVVVRADRTTPFTMLNRLIKTCQTHGFRRFSLKAQIPREA